MTQRPIEILLVEDSPGDIWLTREALMQGPVRKNISVVNNGEQAIDFLRRKGAYIDVPRPDVVLLDLNLPRRDGLDVLREIKTDPGLKTITVIVLTTSEAPVDVNAAYDLNANCYVVKPVDLEGFIVAIRGIESFWMGLASLPTLVPPPISGEASESDRSSSGNGAGSSGNSSSTRKRALPKRGRRGLPEYSRVGRRKRAGAGIGCSGIG